MLIAGVERGFTSIRSNNRIVKQVILNISCKLIFKKRKYLTQYKFSWSVSTSKF